MSENFRIKGEGDFAVTPDEDNELAVVFDMSHWFDGIDILSAKSVEEDGEIVINKNTNQDLLHALKKNIKEATHAGKDANKDGKLSKHEVAGQGQP